MNLEEIVDAINFLSKPFEPEFNFNISTIKANDILGDLSKKQQSISLGIESLKHEKLRLEALNRKTKYADLTNEELANCICYADCDGCEHTELCEENCDGLFAEIAKRLMGIEYETN